MPGFIKRNNQENFYAIQPLKDQLNLFMLILVIGVCFIIKDKFK